jgi:hypothetical protein
MILFLIYNRMLMKLEGVYCRNNSKDHSDLVLNYIF